MDFTVEHFTGLIEDSLLALPYPVIAPALSEPIKYTLSSGGKRLRPVLTLASCAALSHTDGRQAINQAVAIELFHNFTLLHDDVMDNADIRRGRPTVHRRWNANAAILSGDAMLTMASQRLAVEAGDRLAELSECFNDTAIGVYQGQQLDMDYEERTDVTIAEYLEMIRLKTSVLLGCACRLGAIMAGSGDDTAAAMYSYGEALGMAFQLRDDWLDTFGDPAVFGKEIGGDIINRKKTWLLITAMNERRDDTLAILSEDLEPQETVAQIKSLYDSLNLDARCRAIAEDYSRQARDILSKVDLDVRARQFFNTLADSAATRKH